MLLQSFKSDTISKNSKHGMRFVLFSFEWIFNDFIHEEKTGK